jgi:hypothetical protein
MSTFGRFVGQTLRFVAGSVGSFVLWTFWLGLVLLATLQIYIASTNQVAVPGFVLDRLQGPLNASGIRVTFDRASFDPTGRILIHAPHVYLSEFDDAVVTAQAAYIGLDPWALIVGKVDAREVRLVGATVFVPALFSATGSAQAIVNDLDAFLVPGARQLVIRQVTGRVGQLVLSVHGAVTLGRAPDQAHVDTAANLRTHFREFCRGATELLRRLDGFDQPTLDIGLEPAGTRGAVISAQLTARAAKLDTPIAIQATGVRATLRLPLLGDAPALSRLDLAADTLKLPQAVEISAISCTAEMPFQATKPALGPLDFKLTAATVKQNDIWANDVAAWGRSSASDRWQATIEAQILGSPLAVTGDANVTDKTADLRLEGSIAPEIIDVISGRTHIDVRRFFAFDRFDCLRGAAHFGPGWKFEHGSAQVALRGIAAYGVTMEEGTAEIEIDPKRLYAPNAYARVGANFARGSYEHEFANHQFRFLLDGRLRPMDISEWFRSWWPNFFVRFEFPAVPPSASVDVQGIWREGRRSAVFIFVDAKEPLVLGQRFERLRTRLFVRPGFYDGLELYATDAAGGAAHGVFTLTSDVESAKWRTLDIDASSTVAFSLGAHVATALNSEVLAPFEVEQSPAVKVHAHFDGPALEGIRHRRLDLEAHTSGPFRFYHFPLQDVAFTTQLRDEELTVDRIEGHFASGKLTGHAKLWGQGADRRIGFDAALTDASLGQAVTAVQNFTADRKGQARPSPGKFVQEKANVRIDLAASAEGLVPNVMSYHGNGNASLRGAEIGAVPLFGPLSDLLKFTALRFTTAQADFKINGAKLEFPQVSLRGANSAIDAHGQYALDRHELDFRAKVFPFEESGSVIKSVVGAVLAPLSNALEVKLTGSLEKPDWAFVIGPTNLLRTLGGQNEPAPLGPAPEAKPEVPSPATSK